MEKKKDGFQGQMAIVLPRNIIARHCENNPLIAGAYITDIGYYPKARFHYRERSKGIDQHILIYNREGSGWAEIEDQKYNIAPGDFFIAPAGKYNCYAADGNNPWSIYWIHFKGPVADAFVDAFFEKKGAYLGTIAYNPERLAIFEQIYKHLEQGYGQDNLSYVNMRLMHYLSSFLFSDVFNQSTSPEDPSDIINASIRFMQQHMNEMITLEAIAAHVHISVSHYAYLFKKKTGYSPIEYFNQLKVQKACQYLQFTDMRIKEIADQIGIEDPYYFSRLFTKIMSMSPKDYRSKHTQK